MIVNPLGVHSLVWVGELSPEPLRGAVEQSRAAGFDLIELSLHDPGAIDVGHTRAALATAGLDVVCSRGLDFDADISSDDTRTVERGAVQLAESVRLTRVLGGRYFGGALYSALGKYPRPVTARGRANCVAVLRDLAAEAAGITLGLEVVNRYESNVVNTARQALNLIDDIGADGVVVHLDTYHMNIEEGDLARPVHECAERLGYVHVGESHRGYLGSGTIDFPRFFRALAAIDYQGPITFESFSSAVVAEGLSNNLAIWRNLWDDGADLARHARAFVTEQLTAARMNRR